MALPVGIEVGVVTFGSAVSFGGRTTTAKISVVPSARLVYDPDDAGDGIPILNFAEIAEAADGQPGQLMLPLCDQPGFKATQNGTLMWIVDWSYKATLTWTDPETRATDSVTKVFQLLTGQTVIDFDRLPDTVGVLPVSAPIVGVTAFLGKTGNIIADDLTELNLGGGLTDADIGTLIGSSSSIKTALDAGYAARWRGSTSYPADSLVLLPAPISAVGRRIAAGISRSSFDATEQEMWAAASGTVDGLVGAGTFGKTIAKTETAVAARTALEVQSKTENDAQYLTLAGTDPANVPIVKPLGDGRAGVWEFVHDDTQGYLYHLLAGQNTQAAAWVIGIGVDSGLGNGMIIRNKAKGIGIKIEQVPTITSPTAYGMSVEQNSGVAPAVFMEQKPVVGGAAPLFQLVSYETAGNSLFFAWQGANAKGGGVRAATGSLYSEAPVELVGDLARLDARSYDTTSAATRDHVFLDKTGIEFAQYTGSPGLYYQSRVRQNGASFVLEASAFTSQGNAVYEPVIAIGGGDAGWKKLGLFGKNPVERQTLAAEATTAATTQTLANSIRTALIAYGLTL